MHVTHSKMCVSHKCCNFLCVLASGLPVGENQAVAPLPILQHFQKPIDKKALILDMLESLKQRDSRHNTQCFNANHDCCLANVDIAVFAVKPRAKSQYALSGITSSFRIDGLATRT